MIGYRLARPVHCRALPLAIAEFAIPRAYWADARECSRRPTRLRVGSFHKNVPEVGFSFLLNPTTKGHVV